MNLPIFLVVTHGQTPPPAPPRPAPTNMTIHLIYYYHILHIEGELKKSICSIARIVLFLLHTHFLIFSFIYKCLFGVHSKI